MPAIMHPRTSGYRVMISFTVPALLIALGVTHAIQDSARSRPARQDSETAPKKSKKSKKSNKRPGKKRIGGFLGLHISDARLDGKTFVQIDSVVKGSDAEKLGFKAGDRILRINRRRIRNGDAFIMNLWGTAGLLRSRRGGTSRGGVVPATKQDLHPTWRQRDRARGRLRRTRQDARRRPEGS